MSVLKTTDAGINWPVHKDVAVGDYGTACHAVAVAPSDSAIVYAGGQVDRSSKVFRSNDAGNTWSDITDNLTVLNSQIYSYDDTVNAIWVSPYDHETLLVGTPKGVFQRTVVGRDLSSTWIPTTVEHPTVDFTYDLAEDTVYAATTEGVYSTNDDGATWQALNEGLDCLDILCIDIDSENRLLYVGTNGGSVWRLALGPADFSGREFFVVVDDFEDYTDFPPDRIFDTWIDGWDIPTNGATVCYAEPDFLQGGHFVETTIVHTGLQSMPYLYDNSAGYSEAALPLSYPYDWTIQGVELLSLWFHGDPTNASERMYVAIANSRQTPAVVYHDNPDIAQINTWTQWSIELKAFIDQGADLTDLDKLYIGFGDKYNPQAGGSGLVIFDDIRLYRPAEPQTDPGYN
ncbi:MAG: WD40/YVTN/BNR-like repeat-containing protein [Planctomycetota bacterium]|jgi:hypothetical protein